MKTSFPSSDRPIPLMYCACCMRNLVCVEVGTGMYVYRVSALYVQSGVCRGGYGYSCIARERVSIHKDFSITKLCVKS